MKKNATPLIVILSLAASVYLLVFSLPASLPNAGTPDPKIAHKGAGGLPADLIAFVREQRPTDRPDSDLMNDEQLVEQYEDLQDEYSRSRSGNPLKDAMNENLLGVSYDQAELSIPEGLEDIVGFWINVFGVYDKDHVIFHNSRNVGIVYSVLDFSDLNSTDEQSAGTIRNQMVREETARLTRMLSTLGAKLKDPQARLNAEETRIARLIAEDPALIIEELGQPENVMARPGFSHRFRQSIVTAGQYLPEMERIFTERGLPTELTCIPFVESSFNQNAYSSAAAAGIWQFIESTGRNYLNIDEFVDERFDPILSTYAAAAHLAREYKMLKSWPLTINAYNTGPGRMLQAIDELKTQDISVIVKRFRGSGYGFDSRNYFPEVLAAIEVYRNRQRYFGDITPADPIHPEYVELPSSTNLSELFEVAGVDAEVMRKLNATIKPAILKGERELPKGYRLRVPVLDKEAILTAARDLKETYDLGELDRNLPPVRNHADARITNTPTLPNSAPPTIDDAPLAGDSDLAEKPIF